MLSGDCDVCINGKMPSYSATCVECGLSRKHFKPITNGDRFRAMSDEKLAEFLARTDNRCPRNSDHNMCAEEGETCVACWLDWLREEATDG